MHELFSYVLLFQCILFLLCSGSSKACQDTPVSLSNVLYNDGDIVTYSNVLSDSIVFSAGAQACYSLVSPSGSTIASQVKLSIDKFDKLGRLDNCYQTGVPVYDAQCICSRGFLTLTDTSCSSCATNNPAYSTVFCKSGTNTLSSIPSSAPGGYCCNTGITVNPEYHVCDILDQNQIDLVITVSINTTTETLRFDNALIAQKTFKNLFNLTLEFLSLPPILNKRYVLDLSSGKSVIVESSQINGRGSHNPQLPGVTQRVNGAVLYTESFKQLFSAVALTCPIIGSGTFATSWSEIPVSVLFRTAGRSTFPPLSKGYITNTPDGSVFYMGISLFGDFVMSDYSIHSDYNFTGSTLAVAPIWTSPDYNSELFAIDNTCYYQVPNLAFYGLTYKPAAVVCPTAILPVYCTTVQPSWQVIPPFAIATVYPNGTVVREYYWCTDFSGSGLGQFYVNVADPVSFNGVNTSDIFTRSVSDVVEYPNNVNVPISSQGRFIVESKYNFTLNHNPDLEPIIKDIIFDKDPHVTAYLRYGSGLCVLSSQNSVFSPFTVSLDNTPKDIELPYVSKTFSGNDTITLNCGKLSAVKDVQIVAVTGEIIKPTVSYSPFNMSPEANNVKSYVAKGFMYGGLAVSLLIILGLLKYLLFPSKPKKTLTRKRLPN